jgi:hypothetical protein
MIQFFKRTLQELPLPVSTGEIFIVYNLKIQPWNMDIQGWSTHSTTFKLIQPGYDLNYLTRHELPNVNQLREFWSVKGGAAGAKGEVVKRDKEGQVLNEDGPTRPKKLALIRDVKQGQYYDLVGEVTPNTHRD